MSTTNHVVIPNVAPVSSVAIFNQVWKLTRAMKKAGWKYIASGNGASKESGTGDPELDNWGAGTVSNVGGAAAAIAAPIRGRAVVTGLSGIVSTDKGKFLHVSGSGTGANNHYHQIEEIVSATSVKIDARTFAVAVDAGPLTWEIRDPLGDTYPTALNGVSAWWCARGPSTLKIPITAAPVVGGTGLTFVRGENIVQATTGAEGEIIGFVYDGVSAGYLTVAPRLRGTGTGVYGWDTGNVITGSVSGATVTQVGTALEYRHEIVIWKATTTNTGSIFHGCFESVGESSQMFSTVSTAAGCTAVVAPGGGGTGNTFPTFAWVQLGNGTSGSHCTWDTEGTSYAATAGNAQLICCDLIEEQNYSADGSFIYALAAYQAVGGGHVGWAFQRLDDTEDGDLDPYISFSGGTYGTLYANARTSAGDNQSNQGRNYDMFTAQRDWHNTPGSVVFCRGWRGRGIAGDSSSNFQEFEEANLCCHSTGSSGGTLPVENLYGTRLHAQSYLSGDYMVTTLVSTKVKEPIWVVSVQESRKMRKGTFRHIGMVNGGNGTDTYESKTWLQLSPKIGAYIVHPWDGVTSAICF